MKGISSPISNEDSDNNVRSRTVRPDPNCTMRFVAAFINSIRTSRYLPAFWRQACGMFCWSLNVDADKWGHFRVLAGAVGALDLGY